MNANAYIAALQWHVDVGATEALEDTPVDATAMPEIPRHEPADASQGRVTGGAQANQSASAAGLGAGSQVTGTSDAAKAALALAREVDSVESLREAIAGFDGIPLKKTATNMVFSDGNPEAKIMLIGEAPGADEDRQGKPFAGANGQLLDKILGSIGLSRTAEDLEKAVYITNILNWRPPGGRSLNPAEIEVSLPFIEKHIALVKPKVLIFCGGGTAKALLNSSEGMSKLRGKMKDYKTLTDGLLDTPQAIPAIATYTPEQLLLNPGQKRLVWQDMLRLQQFLLEN
ncbi:MAG TPA: uracil-DNA glycosylase [Micavibrio sp.]|nr:uracil-DNA glycosylase [Micavibrio sp.]HIL28734.1 uracil-DNA glycosylase [Micavibrio sp.]